MKTNIIVRQITEADYPIVYNLIGCPVCRTKNALD